MRTRLLAPASLLVLLVLAAPAAGQPPRDFGPQDGDLMTWSGPLEVARGETVRGDVVSLGGPVTVGGRVRGDAVSAGGRVMVSGVVTGDVVALGGTAVLERGARVGGDVVALGGPAVLGPRARVGGRVVAPAATVRVAAGARVGGDVVHGDATPEISPRASVGGAVIRTGAARFAPAFGLFSLVAPIGSALAFLGSWGVGSLISLALGLALLWLGPPASAAAFVVARTEPGAVVAWGFAFVLGVPVAAVLATLTLIGIPLAVVLVLALTPLLALGYAASAWLLGRALVRSPRSPYLALLAGWAILRLSALVPVLGWVAVAAATLFGCGALALVSWRSRHSPATVPAPAVA